MKRKKAFAWSLIIGLSTIIGCAVTWGINTNTIGCIVGLMVFVLLEKL